VDKEAILEEDSRRRLLEESHARRFLYKDVEELIEHGFLTQEVTFGEAHVVFRTLTPGEARRAFLRGASRGAKNNLLRWFLASSVWMIDGFEVSQDPKDNGPWHIYKDWAQNLQDSELEAYISFYVALRNRVNRAVKMIEAYCYEPYSRGLWKLLGKPRWEGGGGNTVRRMWVAYNLSEDASREEDARWHHTRMFVGSMSSKAAKELTRHMEKHENSEKEAQKRAIEEAVNWVIRGDEPEEEIEIEVGGKKISVKKMYSPTSLEELEDEMRKVFAGEEDFHDAAIEAQNQRVREIVEQRKQAQEQAMIAAREKLEEREMSGMGAALVGYTKEQLAELNPEVLQKRGTDTYSDSSEAHRVYDKYIGPKILPGVLSPDLKVHSPERGDPRFQQKPEEAPQSLQSKIASRKPTIGG
jgi:hypothetical protein